jgi:hypothetical protein
MDAHGDSDADAHLRERYAEFVPCEAARPEGSVPAKKARRYQLNPDRVRTKGEFDPARDEQAFVDAEADGNLLHGARRPPVTLQQERPEHRFLVFLYAQGISTKDIFIQLGGEWDASRNAPISGTGQYSYQHLHTIRRQAWFQSKLVQYMEECGKDVVKAKFEMELMPSIDKVIAIRDDQNAPVAIQLRAAESLIDRFLGKAAITVVQQTPSSVERYEKEVAELQAESDALTAQINSLNPSFLTNNE